MAFSGRAILILISLLKFNTANQLKTLHAWRPIDFVYEGYNGSEPNIGSNQVNQFIPENVFILDTDIFTLPNGSVLELVTTPVLQPGVPASLSQLVRQNHSAPILRPFPDWSWHSPRTCNNIVSVFRMKVDKLGRLWVSDTGRINQFTNYSEKLCQPKLLVFDLKNNNTLLRLYEFPKTETVDVSLLTNLEVEVLDRENTWVYLTDPVGYRVHVYNYRKNTSHVVEHPYFYPEPSYGFFYGGGVSYIIMDGVFALTLACRGLLFLAKRPGNNNIIYFHSLSGGREMVVSTAILQNYNSLSVQQKFESFRILPYERKRHISVQTITSSEVLIFANVDDMSIWAWDTKTQYHPRNFNVLAKDEEKLQFPTGMKVHGDQLFISSCKIQTLGRVKIPLSQTKCRILNYPLEKTLLSSKPVHKLHGIVQQS